MNHKYASLIIVLLIAFGVFAFSDFVFGQALISIKFVRQASAPTCNAGAAGALYVGTDDKMYLCNGTAWVQAASNVSGLTVSNFASANISQWTNNSAYITDGNTGWDNSYGYITAASTDTLTNKTWNGVAITDAYVSDTLTASAVPWSGVSSKPTAITRIQDLTGSYGSINVAGALNGYAGINFVDEGLILMMDGAGATGVYTGAAWKWYFDTNGVLTAGTVPWTSVNSRPTALSQFTNDSGFITDGNTNWDNSYGYITAASTDTLTNKSGNISQWTNNSAYITDGNTNWDNSYGYITAASPTFTGNVTMPGTGIWNSSGNVGIGTTAPVSKLQIAIPAGSTTIGSNTGVWIGDGTGGVGVVHQVGFGYSGSSATKPGAVIGGINEENSGFTQEGLFFATRGVTTDSAPTERMRISKDGNVGIGTTGPEVKLHIKQAGVGTGAGDRPQSLYFGSSDNANLRGMIGWSAYGASNYFLIQAVEEAVAWRNIVLARDGGNVGIGTASPDYKLDIVGDANGIVKIDSSETDATVKYANIAGTQYTTANGLYEIIGGTANSGYNIVDIGGGYSGLDAATLIRFYTTSTLNTAGTEVMRISGTGNVGIGTTTPAERLQVHGNIKISSSSAGIIFPDNSVQKRAGPYNGIQVFTANGTFTVPSGVTTVWVELQGGGGGGGGAGNAGFVGGGGGGGAGGYAAELITGLTPGAQISVTVGGGGSGGAGTYPPLGVGGSGGTSSFGSYLSASGGLGGNASYYTSLWNYLFSGGAGGTGSGGNINLQGSAGGGGQNLSAGSTSMCGGHGGSGYHGTGGGLGGCYGTSGGPLAGSAGRTNTGGGGGGAYPYGGTAGYAGGTGIVVVQW